MARGEGPGVRYAALPGISRRRALRTCRNRHHNVALHRGLLRQLAAHLHAYQVHVLTEDETRRVGKIDLLENTGRPASADIATESATRHPLVRDSHNLTGLDVTDTTYAGFKKDHPKGEVLAAPGDRRRYAFDPYKAGGYDKQDSLPRFVKGKKADKRMHQKATVTGVMIGETAYCVPHKEIEKVAKLAHAHEFIRKLPRGYDTLVGERGVKLSGGERQRVAIARAILADTQILVLDEATSSLDSLSEKYIQEALEYLMEGRTTIVIAHRLSTIKKVDRILVIENGKIVEEGTHSALVRKKDGVYREFYELQAGGFIGE